MTTNGSLVLHFHLSPFHLSGSRLKYHCRDGVENVSRTSNGLLEVVVNADHPIVDGCHSVHNSMRGLQILCSGHPSFFLSQLVKSLQRVFYLSPSNQPLRNFS